MEYVTVAQEGFYGLYHVPVKDHDPKKVVIVVGGSEGNVVLCQEKVQIKYAFFRLAYPAKASAFSSNAA